MKPSVNLFPNGSDWITIELGNGSLNLPKERQWCLFEFWKQFPMRHKDGSIEHVKAYGFLVANKGRDSVVHLPLYKQFVNVCKVARWKTVEMPITSSSKEFNHNGGF